MTHICVAGLDQLSFRELDTCSAPSHDLNQRWHFVKCTLSQNDMRNDDVIKWKHFPRYWPFVRGIHQSPVNSPHKGQWRGALMLYLICAWTNGWVNNREAGDLSRHRPHYDVTVIDTKCAIIWMFPFRKMSCKNIMQGRRHSVKGITVKSHERLGVQITGRDCLLTSFFRPKNNHCVIIPLWGESIGHC